MSGERLSTGPAGPRERRFALAAVLASLLFFCAALPFAKIPLAQVPAFVAACGSALVICDLITAVLLFGRYTVLRAPALLVLAGGYLFCALIAVSHALTYPNLFSPAGLLGAGPQSTAWLYFFWHGGFPLFVIVHALLKDKTRPARATGLAILATVAGVLVAACGLTFLATANDDYLPVIMAGHLFSSRLTGIVAGFWSLSFIALALLWRRRPHSALDLWLIVVMCAWILDMGLSAVFNTGRFDFGFYAGRIYGLLAASFLLIVLLIENGRYYARLVEASAQLGIANKSLEALSLNDALTGLANRRFFDRYLGDQMAVARRSNQSLALVLSDIDAFKAYNDHYGHPAGDECLKRVAAAIGACCRRPADMAARYGGEEFAMILPDTELAGAAQIAEAARHAVTQLRIPHAKSPASPFVSISGGVSVLLRKIENTAEQLISAADHALYQAKNAGRNRMIAMRAEPA